MRSLLLLLVLCFPLSAQDFNLEDFVPLVDPVEEVTVPEVDFNPIDLSQVNFESDFEQESKARIEEMRKLAEEIKKIAEEIKGSNLNKMSFDDSKILDLEDRVSFLENQSMNFVTKSDVEALVKEQVDKTVKLTIKSGNVTLERTVPLNTTEESVLYNSVKVPGHVGYFKVKEGEIITHVEGVPVNRTRTYNSGRVFNYSNGYLIQGYKTNSNWNVQIARLASSCRIVNGRLQCN